MDHNRTVSRCNVSESSGLQLALERVTRENDQLRRSRIANIVKKLGLDPGSGPAMHLMGNYLPSKWDSIPLMPRPGSTANTPLRSHWRNCD